MRSFVTIAALMLISAQGQKFLGTEFTEAEREFINFIVQHRRSYGTKEEYNFRLDIFKQKFDEVKRHNALEDKSYTLTMNKFSDLTEHEFKNRLGFIPSKTEDVLEDNLHDGVPNASQVDWVSKGAVTGVKDQGGCGACWAFSSTGAIEGQYAIQHGSQLSFSEQQLIDCDSGLLTNHGCSGGNFVYGFQFAESNSLNLEKDYPYEERDDRSCRQSQHKTYYKISSYATVKSRSESALMSSIEIAPTSVGIEADQLHCQLYDGGILDSGCGTNRDHAVLAVGYGTSSGKDYYKVKNSWGPGWGENGYIRIWRNGDGNGICGIQMDAKRPIA